MPNENDVIYYELVDDKNQIVNTGMVAKSHAKHVLESASELFGDRKENQNGIS